MMIDLDNMPQGRWITIFTTKVFVDDLRFAYIGSPKYFIRVLAAFIDFVADALENGMCMQLSLKKSSVIASKPTMAQASSEATHGGKESGDRHAKLLGTVIVGG